MSHKNSMQELKIVFFIFYRVSAIALTALFCSNLVFAETITELKDKAQAGNAEAQFKLGVRYYRGDGVDKNQVEAVKLLQKSSDKGNTYAQNLLATAYSNGNGVEKDPRRAFELWQKSASQGNENAQNNLAFAYLFGIGVAKNATKAFELWLQAAENDDVYAQEHLARAYKDGIGVQKNLEKANFWSLKAFKQTLIKAQNGELDFQYKLGESYLYGNGVKKDSKEALHWFRSAAESGNIEAQAKLGTLYSRNSFMLGDSSYENPEEARKWLYLAAEAGSSTAQRNLGVQFEHGVDGFEKNIKEALKWYRKAAENGDQVSLRNAKELEGQLEAASDKPFDKMLNEQEADVSKTTSQAKLALLIANSNYSQFGGLARTESDAKSLSNVLDSMGFQVFLLKNASREQMLDALKSFENKVRGTEALAFFHYGGHGVQVDGKNYLIPADAEIPDERRVATRAVDLDEVIASIEMAKPKASVLVVDACRHNPLPASPTRAATRGLAVVGRKPKNSVIIFAAEAGNEALDGLFTPIFAKNLQQHGDKSLNQIMQKVRAEVFERSNGAQTPGEYNQLFDDVYLYKDK
jgi:TPR repeat protein